MSRKSTRQEWFQNIFRAMKPFRAKAVSIGICICLVVACLPIAAWALEYKRPGAKLSSGSVGITLTSGTYYVDSNVTITAKQGPAIDIADGAEVIIYIDPGKTLKCVGGDGYCTVAYVSGEYKATMVQAGAGIHIPKSASLTLMGSGSVIAEGGDGYENTGGHDATSGSYYWCKDASQSWVISGRGGTGGTGTGSPAAGVGANGTNGRDGEVSTTVKLTGSRSDTTIDAKDGESTPGYTGESMGTLYVWDSVKVNATAGVVKNNDAAAVGRGSASVASSYKEYNGSSNDFRLVAACCGGGSAGGKVSGTPNAIGGALGGGGSGASGARGAIANMRKAGTWKKIGKLGFVSTYNDADFASHCNAANYRSGYTGGLWDYDGKMYSGKGGLIGNQGNAGEGGMLCNYPSASVSGKTNSTKNTLVKVSIDLKKDGQTGTSWAKEQTITLCKKETNGAYTQLYELFNCDFHTGVKSSNYFYEIPANTGELYVFVNGVYTGQILNIQNRDLSDTVNAYTTTINLFGNLEPKADSKVQFYDEGNLTYTFDEVEAGVYEAIVIYRPNSVDNNRYEIYVDEKSTQKWLNFSANNHEMTVNFFDLTVYVTEDEVNKGEQGVTLWRNDRLCYTMWEQDDHSYTYRLIAEKNAPEATGTYDIFVNGEDSGKEIDFSSVAKLTAEIPYITVKITLRKDDVPWTDATVRVRNEAGEQFDLAHQGEGIYQKLLRADTYTPVVAGVAGNTNLSDILSISNKTMEADYYTVTFHRNFAGLEHVDIYQTYILRKGAYIPVPLKPAAGGGSFSFWSSDVLGATDAFDFTQGISSKTDLYAIWDLPSVLIGEEIRCNESGVTDGSGQYYRMKNLTLSGFDENYRISNIQLDYTNIEKITLPTTDLDFEEMKTVGTNTDGTQTERMVLHFTSQITVKQAEGLLREMIVQPKVGEEHTMQVTVFTEPVAE